MQMVEEQILRGVQGPELNQQERGRRGRWNRRKRRFDTLGSGIPAPYRAHINAEEAREFHRPTDNPPKSKEKLGVAFEWDVTKLGFRGRQDITRPVCILLAKISTELIAIPFQNVMKRNEGNPKYG